MIDKRWTQVSRVPVDKLKTIGFGALKGKSDINPQWRIKAMTETYGLCGIGWYHELNKNWTETAPNGSVMAFCLVNVYIKDNGEWSKPICGMGGNEIVSIAKGELKQSDEGWKMAYTDALGTALKSIGVASEIYEGNFDGSKYQKTDQPATTDKLEPPKKEPEKPKEKTFNEKCAELPTIAKAHGIDDFGDFATFTGISKGMETRQNNLNMYVSEPVIFLEEINRYLKEIEAGLTGNKDPDTIPF